MHVIAADVEQDRTDEVLIALGTAKSKRSVTIFAQVTGIRAAALAAELCYATIGTDTGGSIRIPSASCVTVGLKPTRDRVPLNSVLPLAWSLDHMGPMTLTAAQRIAECVVVLKASRIRPAGAASP